MVPKNRQSTKKYYYNSMTVHSYPFHHPYTAERLAEESPQYEERNIQEHQSCDQADYSKQPGAQRDSMVFHANRLEDGK
jgi:hypothetical protein